MAENLDFNFNLPQIPDTRYLRIGTVSELSDLPQHVLRYWESQFEVLKPMRRGGNRRYYTKQDVYLILKIKFLLKDQGYTIDGAREYLKRENQAPPKVDESTTRKIQHAIANLRQVKEILSVD